jgi:hypothetical protein
VGVIVERIKSPNQTLHSPLVEKRRNVQQLFSTPWAAMDMATARLMFQKPKKPGVAIVKSAIFCQR